ncbi:hypothetical protein HID58_069497 [Brassica napus]|uniref:Uncharacterized protein n=1 Tax=Brassica napus TaxID=3708 RepID=A0ABQ7YW46_BRANA|nr:hypothetical protein HID58_069497 [Brassica napus]
MLGHESVMHNRPISFIDPFVLLYSSLRHLQTLQNSPSFHFLRITPATETMMNQSYPPDKSACNSPHPSSYSMILMPLEDPLVNHSYEISQLSPFRVETIYIYIYIYPNPTIPCSANASQHYGKSNDSHHRASHSPLLFHQDQEIPKTSIKSKGGILIGTKYVTVDFFNHHHPQLGVVMGVIEGMFYLLEQWHKITFDLNTSSVLITNLKPGEEQEDPERRLKREHCKQVITLGLMFTDKSPLKQTKLQRRFMTWCFFV